MTGWEIGAGVGGLIVACGRRWGRWVVGILDFGEEMGVGGGIGSGFDFG